MWKVCEALLTWYQRILNDLKEHQALTPSYTLTPLISHSHQRNPGEAVEDPPHTTTLLPNLNDTELSTSDPSSSIQKRTPGVAVEAGPSPHHHLAAQSQWYRTEYLGSKQWRSKEDSRSSSRGWTLHTPPLCCQPLHLKLPSSCRNFYVMCVTDQRA
jgi:hypothetical protein